MANRFFLSTWKGNIQISCWVSCWDQMQHRFWSWEEMDKEKKSDRPCFNVSIFTEQTLNSIYLYTYIVYIFFKAVVMIMCDIFQVIKSTFFCSANFIVLVFVFLLVFLLIFFVCESILWFFYQSYQQLLLLFLNCHF